MNFKHTSLYINLKFPEAAELEFNLNPKRDTCAYSKCLLYDLVQSLNSTSNVILFTLPYKIYCTLPAYNLTRESVFISSRAYFKLKYSNTSPASSLYTVPGNFRYRS